MTSSGKAKVGACYPDVLDPGDLETVVERLHPDVCVPGAPLGNRSA
ncbi:MAG TPA: hypothetical protein VFJ09_01100 [Nocardioidaceae bacterium]|nr:hypothetical protein [Nocardioidaceae bacterium]